VVPFPPCGPPLLGCLLAWTWVLAPCYFSSPFLGCFLSIKFGRVSSHLDSAYVKSLVVHITKPLLILQKKVEIRFDLESRPDSTYYTHPQNYLADVVQSIKSNTTYLITTCDDLSKENLLALKIVHSSTSVFAYIENLNCICKQSWVQVPMRILFHSPVLVLAR